jgi:arabinogalactan oligomer/maltooligosaccharide transport system permease protein
MTAMNQPIARNKISGRRRAVNILVHLLLAVLAFIWIMPIIWIVLTSFRAEPGSYVNTFFPKGYTLNNYIKLFTDRNVLNFPKMFMNTLIIACISCVVSTFFMLSVSYSLSRMRFKMRKPYMNLAMILGLFPGFMSMVAQYYILKALGLTEGSMIRLALIIVYSAGAGLAFQISKGYFDTIPRSIDEAAMIDGASQWQVFTQITMPLSKPIVIYTVMTSVIGPWVDFIFAKVICRANADQFTVAIGLWNMLQKEYINQWYTCFAAGAVVISIPIAALFLYMQKFYVEGMTGAVKG